MNIEQKGFQVILHGKCISKYDVVQMYNFGYSIDGIAKKYADDNKITKKEADKIVNNIIYENVMDKNKGGK